MMNLFLVHCGYYDDPVFESHQNFYIVAENVKQAKLKAKELAEFKQKNMHVDGVLLLDNIDGYRIVPEKIEATTSV